MPDVFLIILGFVFGVVVVFSLVTTIYTAIICSPFLATPKKIIRKALLLAGLKNGEKFYDLGCGNGRAVVIASREFFAISTGFELSWHHFLMAKINCFLFNKTANVFWKNFYKQSLSDADVIFCFLTPKAFPKLEEKFQRELKTGSRIVTYSSPLPNWLPAKIIKPFPKDVRLFLYIKPEETQYQ